MDEAWAAEVGERIREARRKAGISRDALADLLDRSKSTINMYEQGRRAPWNEIRQIAEVTNTDLRWLLHGDSYQDPLDVIAERLRRVEEALAVRSANEPVGEAAQTEEELAAMIEPAIPQGGEGDLDAAAAAALRAAEEGPPGSPLEGCESSKAKSGRGK